MVRTIPRKTWYFFLLSLPVLVALPAWLLREHQGDLALLLGGPMLIAGPQYIVFVYGFLLWGHDKPEAHIWAMRYWLPLLFYPVCVLGLGLYFDSFALYNSMESIGFAGALLPLVLIYGYAYVFIAVGLTHLLTKAGLLEECEHART